MKRTLVLIALVVTLVLPATVTASRCHLGGSGHKTICLCPAANGRFRSAPMWRCK